MIPTLFVSPLRLAAASFTLLLCLVTTGAAQQPAARGREFPPGSLTRFDQLPPGRFRSQIEQLPPAAQDRASQWLQSFHFTEGDLSSLHADSAGGIFFVCDGAVNAATSPTEPVTSEAAVPISPFPASLVFHSRPGAPNILYLNFTGENVTNTQWNTSLGRDPIPALPFSSDGDFTTFSDSEQLAIKRIWQRVAEDYAPFNVDVTTARPATFGLRTANVLITRSTDANGAANPSSTAGGVAYVNVFNNSNPSYASYRPAWVYHNNLGPNEESYIAEAASHEAGHNFGLSHDATSTASYYGGHGSGDTSWGPLMGTGYNRNVSQWSKGEYYDANNTEDDLALIAAKISYRTDDVGNTNSTATALVFTGGTNIVSTTPETDPTNANPANKGVIERNTDVDVFSFVTGTGPINLSVNPWVVPSALTRGGNLDISLELRGAGGVLLATNNPASLTSASIQTNLAGGQYFLYVRNTGVGTPLSSSPSGYTAYGSLGQYFISGYVSTATNVVVPPQAQLAVSDLTQAGQANWQFTVTYSDNLAINVSTIDTNDLRITGPNGYDRAAKFLSLDLAGNGTPRTATYAALPPAGAVWTAGDNGVYAIFMRSNQVADTEGAFVAPAQLGQFNVNLPVVLYSANMDSNPGWTLEPDWQYGAPGYASGSGPTSGYTGTKIIGYNLGGNYTKSISTKYAVTPAINCAGSSSLTLRFRRWLGLRSGDTALIQASTNGIDWVNVWSTSGVVKDTAWQEVQYTLPAGMAGSPSVRVRWGLGSNADNKFDIGWNLDDVELLGDGSADTTPPVASLSVANLTTGGSPSHSCTVTYTDDTAVRLASLDSADLLVTGPNGYTNLTTFGGADLPVDGSPITASYSIAAPGGEWDVADNGTYEIVLLGNEVEDIFNNAAAQTSLGSFTVAIALPAPGVLGVSPAAGLSAAGTVGGPFTPAGLTYTLTNSGASSFTWAAAATQNWVSLSATNGTLAPAASTTILVSLNTSANSLGAGSYGGVISFTNTTTGGSPATRPVSLTVNPLPTFFALALAANNPAWGSVSPTSGVYVAGSALQLLATPATYFRFNTWTGDVSATNDPLNLVLNTNLSAMAVFGEILTTNHPTPHWWLAANGYTNDFESAVNSLGANGYPVWESYIAGLEPTNPASQLRLVGAPAGSEAAFVLNWNTVTGRVYSLWSSTNLAAGFVPLSGATHLPWTVQGFTNPVAPVSLNEFYRIEVQKP